MLSVVVLALGGALNCATNRGRGSDVDTARKRGDAAAFGAGSKDTYRSPAIEEYANRVDEKTKALYQSMHNFTRIDATKDKSWFERPPTRYYEARASTVMRLHANDPGFKLEYRRGENERGALVTPAESQGVTEVIV